MKIIAHRGASADAIENSLAAMALAVEQGADAIELDVHLCQGQLVVFHDFSVDKLTDGHGKLAKLTFEQLRQLTLHPRRRSALNQRQPGLSGQIPTLWEVLQLLSPQQGRRIDINIELKGSQSQQPLLQLLALAESELGYQPQQFLISSFKTGCLKALARQTQRYPLGILSHSRDSQALFDLAAQLKAVAIHPHYPQLTAELVSRAHQLGLKVFSYTVDQPQQLLRLKQLGVDGVFTNAPAQSRQHLANL